MAITASYGKRIKRDDRRRNDGLQKSSYMRQTEIWMQLLSS